MKLSVVLFGCVLTCAACGGSEPAKPAETPAPSAANKTPPTPPAPETRMPSATATPISLPPYTTAGVFNGTLAADKDTEFVIEQRKGTMLFASVIGQDADPFLSIHRGDTGADLPDEHKANIGHWIARIPETMGYLIVIHKTGKATPFSLTLEAPRMLFFGQQTSAEVTLALPPNGEAAFLIPPSESITAELTGGGKDAYMTLNAMDDGQPMLKAEANGRTFTGAAKKTTDMVVLRVQQAVEAGDITLKATRK